jgi:3-deoxy-D-manno-octulosonic-acid transferase
MLKLYSGLMRCAMPLIVGRIAWRGIANRPYWRDIPERFGWVDVQHSAGPRVWIHAVSVGEVQAATPLVKALKQARSDVDIVVSTTTPTGRVSAVAGLGGLPVLYAPIDTPGSVRRFLDEVRPDVLVNMETELWPNLFAECARRNIAVVLANVRLSERSARGYVRFSSLMSTTLESVSIALAQTERDGRRLLEIGLPAERLHVCGSVKFDVRLPPSVREAGAALRRRWGSDRSVFIAASTHEGEERQVLDAFERLLRHKPDALLALVPRHPERFSRVAALCRKAGFATSLHSESSGACDDVQVYVGDTMGDLPVFYAGSDVAFVGGSLVDVGGHNVLEPAALGLPVLTGPHVHNFADITGRLVDAGAARFVRDADALAEQARAWLDDANARHHAGQLGQRFVEANRGALSATMDAILHQLSECQLPDHQGDEDDAR